MWCPVCVETKMEDSVRGGATIKICPNCKGAWIDKYGIEKITQEIRKLQAIGYEDDGVHQKIEWVSKWCPVCVEIIMDDSVRGGAAIKICPCCQGAWINKSGIEKITQEVRRLQDKWNSDTNSKRKSENISTSLDVTSAAVVDAKVQVAGSLFEGVLGLLGAIFDGI